MSIGFSFDGLLGAAGCSRRRQMTPPYPESKAFRKGGRHSSKAPYMAPLGCAVPIKKHCILIASFIALIISD